MSSKAVAFPLVATLGLLLVITLLAAGRVEQRQFRRFGLKDFLLFVLLGAVWCSPLAFRSPQPRLDEQFLWQHDTIWLCAWAILAGFYWKYRLLAPLAVHGGGPMFYGIFVVICWTANGAIEPGLGATGWILTVGAGISSFVSFPFALIVVLRRFIRGIRTSSMADTDQPQSPPSADQPGG